MHINTEHILLTRGFKRRNYWGEQLMPNIDRNPVTQVGVGWEQEEEYMSLAV